MKHKEGQRKREMNKQILGNQALFFSPFFFFNFIVMDLGAAVRLSAFKLHERVMAYTYQKPVFTPRCQPKHRVRFPLILISQMPQEAKMEQ